MERDDWPFLEPSSRMVSPPPLTSPRPHPRGSPGKAAQGGQGKGPAAGKRGLCGAGGEGNADQGEPPPHPQEGRAGAQRAGLRGGGERRVVRSEQLLQSRPGSLGGGGRQEPTLSSPSPALGPGLPGKPHWVSPLRPGQHAQRGPPPPRLPLAPPRRPYPKASPRRCEQATCPKLDFPSRRPPPRRGLLDQSVKQNSGFRRSLRCLQLPAC